MATEYHEFSGYAELEEASSLRISRAIRICDAVKKNNDYKVVKILRANDATRECLVVDVKCDGVPSRNNVGIEYVERLALIINEDPKRLIGVFALRKNFPVLIHQNQGIPGEPASLCLYYESAAEVHRNWTPQNFLRRIQWWLEKSARGELHPADQPVENLFFSSPYELILPWNLEELRQQQNPNFVILRGVDRANGEMSFFLRANPQNENINGKVFFIELTLLPVIHGFVESDPATLGGLADMLSNRGVALLPPLIAEQRNQVTPEGVFQDPSQKITIILLRIPIKRDEEAEPSRIVHRAFFMPLGGLELGVLTGALINVDGRYFSAEGVLAGVTESPLEWRESTVLPVDVLTELDGKAARFQSGIVDEGPNAALIGAGSLGSAMLNLWGRSGWGKWTVLDKDHVKPHNLSRHVAYAVQIGLPKVDVVANLHKTVSPGLSTIKPINADVCDQTNDAVRRAITENDLVIDASTTLEYPRIVSFNDEAARHMSVFVTPTGSGSVLLAEDKNRAFRLRTLEAQYYRALIRSEWADGHHTLPPRTFWSGASCRDISFVMPYSKIVAHAATLAEQIQHAASQDGPLVRIWQRDEQNGSVVPYDISVASEKEISLGEYKIYIDEALIEQLKAWRTESFPNETGGILLGYYDFNIMSVFIIDALDAPSDSVGTPGSFKRGTKGLTEAIEKANQRTAGMVSYIGEWHSHPSGHRADPSTDDVIQITQLAIGMAEDGLPIIQLIVGDDGINVLQATLK